MAFFKNFYNLYLRAKQTLEFLSPVSRESFSTTIKIELPDVGDRFVNNPELRECLQGTGLLKVLDALPHDCDFGESDWKELLNNELVAIMYTQSYANKSHWQKLHDRAFEELASRPKDVYDAVFIYKKYLPVQGWCRGDCFDKMFKRIFKQETTDAGQRFFWNYVLKGVPENSPVYNRAYEYLNPKKVLEEAV